LNKMVVLCSIFVIVAFFLGMYISSVESDDCQSVDGIDAKAVIIQKETALKVGKALLEEHFSDEFLTEEETLVAEEKNGKWRVYTVFDGNGITDDGLFYDDVGGELYVEFHANNCKVIKIGIAE